MRCIVGECPYRGKCDLEERDAEICGVYQINTHDAIERFNTACYNRRSAAKKQDKICPIVGVA